MDVNIPQLAADTAKFLAPFLPFLIQGAKDAARAAFERAGEKFTDEMWERGKQLWEKLNPKIKEREALHRAEKKPEDPKVIQNLQGSLELQLEDVFNEDAGLAKFVVGHIENLYKIEVKGNVENATLIAGTGNQVINAQTYIQGNVYNGPAPRNPQDALKVYRAVMANMTANLSLSGIDLRASDPSTQRTMGLANVYIDLNTTAQQEKEKKHSKTDNLKELSETERLAFVMDSIRTEPLSALEAVIENQMLVIKGDPGSGKSTFVNYITYCLSKDLSERLEGWNHEEADLLPVIVILRDFIKSFKKLPEHAEPRHIWDFIEKRLKDQNLSSASKPIQELLEQGKVLLFLDGLDEVTSIPQRVFVRDAVHAFVKRFPKNRFVVTCRILSYTEPKDHEPDLRLAKFPEFELAPFNNEQINAFVEHWYAELTNLGSLTAERGRELQNGLTTQINQRTELKKLAGNPLLLTVMAVVNTDEGQLPDTRAKLYETTIEKLLWQWELSSKGKDSARLRQLLQEANASDTDLKQVIWKLAFEAHAQTDADKDDDEALAGIGELALEKALAAINKGDRNWAASVIETMKMRAGLLLERENHVFTFPHRSFQEFLAGTYLETKDDFVAQAMTLADNQLLWRQVILWAVSRRVYIRGSIDGSLGLTAELCPNREPKDENEWKRVWLAGDILLEIGTNRAERAELGRELLNRVQNRLAALLQGSHLTPRERAEAGNTLARLGDPRHGVTDDFVFCEIPAGKFLMGSNEQDDPDSYEDERPQFEYNIPYHYFMSRYPITNAQFELFVKDPQGYSNDEWWTKAGLEWRGSRREHKRYGGVFSLANHPVIGVTWYEARAFCNWLTGQFQVPGARCQVYDPKTDSIRSDDDLKSKIVNRQSNIRLPTEAEWERAARGGHGHRYPWSSDEITPDHANYGDTRLNATSAVGAFPHGMNPYGLLDMSGNVWEWCATEWHENYAEYLKKENNDPEEEKLRVVRGGAFHYNGRSVRCACRLRSDPDDEYGIIGFRVVVVSHFS